MLVYIHTGSLCNSQCPDELILGEPTSNKWHIGVKLAIVVLVVGLSIDHLYSYQVDVLCVASSFREEV